MSGKHGKTLAAIAVLGAAAPPTAEVVDGEEPEHAAQGAPLRAVFDASVACAVDGRRVTFAPGDPVPSHIDPTTLPAGAVRYLPEEG